MIKENELRVIIYGVGGSLEQSLEYIKQRFDIVAFSDSDSTKRMSPMIKGSVFINPENINDTQYDYIFICSIYDEEIKSHLMQKYGILEGKIKTRSQWCHIPVLCSFGDKNPDEIFYVMGRKIRSRNGLLSIVYGVIEQLVEIEGKGYIPIVDMQFNHNQYQEDKDYGSKNAWNYYFKELSPYTIEEVYNSKNVILGYDDPDYMFNYQERINIRHYRSIYEKYIQVVPDILDEVKNIDDRLHISSRKTLGVVCRGTDYINIKPKNHPIQPSVNEMINMAQRGINSNKYDQIYLATEDMEILIQFIDELGEKVVYSPQLRFDETGDKWLADIMFDRKKDRYIRGREYLITALLLKKCSALYGGICTASVFGHIIGENSFEEVDIICRGVY